MATPLLEIRNATKVYGGGFLSSTPPIVALDDFSLTIYDTPATITTIAGESGSGKTTLASAVLGFLTLTSGQILYKGKDITLQNYDEAMDYRREVQAVFQDPYEVYNPFYRVKHIFDMVVKRFNLATNEKQARDVIESGLKMVGLRGEEVLEKYPHQLSGGQRQRIMVARAILLNPRLIVADEPVSAVDASLRAMILDVMLRMRDDLGISFLYITHDLSTAYQIGNDIYVLYQGGVAEYGKTTHVIEEPRHPYVQLLVNSIPVPDPRVKWDEMTQIPSEEESRKLSNKGCRFYPRCPYHMDRCLEAKPPLYRIREAQEASCYLYDEESRENGKGLDETPGEHTEAAMKAES